MAYGKMSRGESDGDGYGKSGGKGGADGSYGALRKCGLTGSVKREMGLPMDSGVRSAISQGEAATNLKGPKPVTPSL